MTTYTLQTMTLPAGVLTIKIHSTFSDLRLPMINTLKFSSEIVERVQAIAGVSEPEQVEFSFIEDYHFYTEGFWFKVLNDSAFEVQLLIDEGAGDTHLFWGVIVAAPSSFDEVDLTYGNVRRVGRFYCISKIAQLKAVAFADLVTECDLHLTVASGGSGASFIKVFEVIASMMAVAWGTAYDPTAVSISTQETLSFSYETSFYDQSLTLVYVLWKDQYGVYINYAQEANYQRFGNAFEFLKQLCQDLGYYPRYVYDVVNAKHTIQLMGIGSLLSLNPTLSPRVPIKSTRYISSDSQVAAVQIHAKENSTGNPKYYWVDENGHNYGTEIAPIGSDYAYPNTASPMTLPMLFYPQSMHYYGISVGLVALVYNVMRYRDRNDAWQFVFAWPPVTGEPNNYLSAPYRYYEVLGGNRSMYERVYFPMSGLGHFQEMWKPMLRTTIDDGVSTKTYWASEIRKDVIANKVTVKWLELV